ncbi:MAG: peptide ABC transporter substrate-binding protein [Anaerolineae bacterium]
MEPLHTLLACSPLGRQLQKRLTRFPKLYDLDLLKLSRQLLVPEDESFSQRRSSNQLARLICTHHYLRKCLVHPTSSQKRQILLKCYPSKTEEKRVLSIAFAVHVSHSHQVPEEKHLSRALAPFLLGTKIIPNSFYVYLEKPSLCLFCYFEIEKPWGNKIASHQIRLLQEKLPNELLQCIQSLLPSLLILYNQEEVYKNIVQLSKELCSVKDLPQVMISPQAHSQDILYFQVIAVRVNKKSSPLSIDHLSSSIRLNIQKIIPLNALSKKCQKEALVFQLEIDSHLFLRRNWSIDLRQARNCAAKVIEQVLGPFRDYNGGLFAQQDKQFAQIRRILKNKYEHIHFLIEELFHGLSPSVLQTLIPPSIASRLFFLFARLLKKQLPKKGFFIERKKYKESSLLMLKTHTKKVRDHFLKHIENASHKEDSYFGMSSIDYEGMYYLCLVDLNSVHSNIFEHFEQPFRQQKGLSENNEKRKILRINFQEGDPPSLNPHFGTDMRCQCLGKALFEGLMRLNPNEEPELAAAQEIKISACQTHYTFLLREHCWSNGEAVTAYDFEHAWKKALFFGSDSLCSELFYLIKNARNAKEGRLNVKEVKVKALNANLLQVEIEKPALHFLKVITHPAFSPLYKGEEEPVHFNGPFIVKKWERDHYLHLTANPYYWDSIHVPFQEIFFSMVKDTPTISRMFADGELDWIGDPFNVLSSEEILSCQKISRLNTKKVDRTYWIYPNTFFPLFQSAKIRKALAFAMNRKQLIAEVFNGYIPQLSPIPDTRLRQKFSYDGDIDLAQQLFKEGLKEINLTQDSLPQIMFHFSAISDQRKLVRILQEQLGSALGIKIKPVEIDWNDLLNLIDKRDFQLIGCFRSSPYFYPYSYLELLRNSRNSANGSQWENQNYQSLLAKADQTANKKTKNALLRQAEQVLFGEMPVIPLFQPAYKYFLSKKIKKVVIPRNGRVDLKWLSLNERF